MTQLPFAMARASTVPVHPALSAFHPLVQAWFAEVLGDPTEPQILGWPIIAAGKNVLIAAPTGSGKTLSAFLACLDQLFRLSLTAELPVSTQVLYVSPLKALGNDVQKNLLEPLAQLQERARLAGYSPQPLRVGLRTGDTPAAERAAMLKHPPHILITTPESLYLCLTAGKSRENLKAVRTVIVDEIHALARDKRGSHFALSMERLRALNKDALQVIGLSATQKPLDRLAEFLTGTERACEFVTVGHVRPWELRLETPEEELTAVATHEQWGQVYDRLVQLSGENRTMLVFANTRKLSERVAHDLGERLGEGLVTAHHGSMSRELRLRAEDRLKRGELKVMVATASLELGIDVGAIDLVVQLGSPRSIAVMLQRLGRSGHHKSRVSKGLLVAMTRDELVECTALLRAIHEKTLDAVRMPDKPLDILAQTIVAEIAAAEWDEDSLFSMVKRAMPYQSLERAEFEAVLHLVAEGVSTRRGRSRVHLHRDRVNGWLRPRKGARLMALQNGGAIPDTFIYPVIAEPEEKQVGTLDEDFAIESAPGDVFVLGSTSWRIRRVFDGQVRVEDAKGLPPSIPFWLGEAPSRTEELSFEVGKLRDDLLARDDAFEFLSQVLGVPEHTAQFLLQYLRAGAAQLTATPSQTTVVAERFFDEAGGMQLVIHAPFGGRINRAWGMALRKSFCRSFDFELQAAATDDAILLSLSEQHSFPLMDIFDFVAPQTAKNVLTQAVLQSPMFGTRFRWNAGRSLSLQRTSSGKRVPPPIQRARAEDLLASVFPEQVGCQDNHGGMDLAPPDHPLVNETLKDCLNDALDIDGLVAVLTRLKDGSIRKVAVDLPEPSVFAHAMLSSAPYTFLDDAPLEERRVRAMSVRRTLPAPGEAEHLGALDASAIAQVKDEASPELRSAEELHDALLMLCVWPLNEEGGWQREWARALQAAGRAGTLTVGDKHYLYAAERVPAVRGVFGESAVALAPLPGDAPLDAEAGCLQIVRGWMEVEGPTTVGALAAKLSIPASDVNQALHRLESQGQVLRGAFSPQGGADADIEWCDRRLLQRIHRLTVGRLRREIEPLSAQDFMRFLFRWQRVEPGTQAVGPRALATALSFLEGFEAPAAAWEQALFPARLKQYFPEALERASFTGEVAWGRVTLRAAPSIGPRRGLAALEPTVPRRSATVTRSASLTFTRRENMEWLLALARPDALLADGPAPWPQGLSAAALDVAQALDRRGASFFAELVSSTKRVPAEIEDALWELVARGVVSADAVENLRVLQSPKLRKQRRALARGGPGRWSLLRPQERFEHDDLVERAARLFLRRWGIVFRDLVVREPLSPPWRELLPVYRRLEARGEIRGGRMVSGFSGEQFCLPEALDQARAVRRAKALGVRITLSATDPLNLTGIITPGPRMAAVMGHEVSYVDGVPDSNATLQSEGALPRSMKKMSTPVTDT